jgi:hypothetical protein
MSVVLLGSTSGSITLQEPAVAGTNTVNFGANTGVAILDANTPAFRNRIINGAMVIDQRNAGASTAFTTAWKYYLDRWQGRLMSGTGSPTISQSSTVPEGFTSSLFITNGTGASPAAGDTNTIQQVIEGFNTADLGWGTANAKPVTVSFWVRSSLTGTFGGSLTNTSTRSYPFTYTISTANTWEYKTVTIAGDTGGTWLFTNGIGIQVYFDLGSGTTFQGTAGAWTGADYRAATGGTKIVSTTGATFYITGVQLEKGSTATSFDYRPYGTELALCQRYFWNCNLGNTSSTSSGPCGFADTTTVALMEFFPPVPMRVAPTSMTTSGTASDYALRIQGSNTVSCSAVPTLSNPTPSNSLVLATVASGLTAGGGLFIRGNNASDRYLGFSAEL